jgi:hypothetical protein
LKPAIKLGGGADGRGGLGPGNGINSGATVDDGNGGMDGRAGVSTDGEYIMLDLVLTVLLLRLAAEITLLLAVVAVELEELLRAVAEILNEINGLESFRRSISCNQIKAQRFSLTMIAANVVNNNTIALPDTFIFMSTLTTISTVRRNNTEPRRPLL